MSERIDKARDAELVIGLTGEGLAAYFIHQAIAFAPIAPVLAAIFLVAGISTAVVGVVSHGDALRRTITIGRKIKAGKAN